MNITQYRIGMVVSVLGLNDSQTAEVKKRISTIAKLLGTEGRVELVLPGFSDTDSHEGMPGSVMNLSYVMGVKALTIIPCGRRGQLWGRAFHELKHCDEVWCCPGEGQFSYMSRTRTARIYRAGLADPAHHQKFKLIPPWISAPEVEKTKTKKAKKEKRHDRFARNW